MAKIIVLKGTGSVQADRLSINTNFENVNADIATLFDSIANIELTPGPTGPAGVNGATGATGSVSIELIAKTPTDTGSSGDFAYDSSYIYICVDTDTWIRVAVQTSW